MMWDLILKLINSKNKKAVIYIAAFLLLVCVLSAVCLLWGDDPEPTQTQQAAQSIRHEVERSERLTNLIDDRKEAELREAEKITVNSDDVLSTIDNLVRSHSGK